MIDPAYAHEDYEQDAQLAILDGRLSFKGLGAAIANAKASQHRKVSCRQKHRNAVQRHQQQMRAAAKERQDPAAEVVNKDLAITCAGRLFKEDPELFAVLLLREMGVSRQKIASITGQSVGTISRSQRRAQGICQ